MSERAATAAAAAAAGQSAVRGVSAHREKAGLNASAEGVREMNLWHHRHDPEVVCFIHLILFLSHYNNFLCSRDLLLNLILNWLFYFSQILSHPLAPTGRRTTVVMPAHAIPSGSLRPPPRPAESLIALSEATAPAERVRGGTGKQLSFILSHIFYTPGTMALVLFREFPSSGCL